MRTIQKYPLSQGHLYEGAIFRFAAFQNGDLYLWFEVETENPQIPIRFRLFQTDQYIYDSWDYLGTIQEGVDILHLFVEEIGT